MSEIFLFIGLLTGQLGRIQVSSDIALTLSDIAVFIYIVMKVYGNIFLLKKIRIETFFLIKPLALVIFVFAVSLLANAWKFAPQQNFTGLAYLARFILYLMVYFVVRSERKNATVWFIWLYRLGTGFVILGFIQIFLYPDLRNLTYLGYDPHFRRMFTTLLDPNFTGIIFVLTFIMGIYLLNKKKIKQSYMQIILIIGIILTFSRSSFVAALAAALYYAIVTKRWKLLVIICEMVMVMGLIPAIGGISTSPTRLWSVYARIENWKEGIQIFRESPVAGVGFDMLRSVPRITTVSGYVSHAAGGIDNSYLFLAATTGIMGIVAFVYLFRVFILLTKKVQKENVHLSLAYTASLIAIVVHSLFVNSMFYPTILLWIWVLTAAVEKYAGTISDS